MITKSARGLAIGVMLLGARPAWACPLCESETGERVRASLFGAEFGPDLFMTLLPFPLFLAIVALIHFGVPRAKGTPRPSPPSGVATAGGPVPEPPRDGHG